jgi:glyceraldehyde-3-phosphate dehydrogenase (ferredoxin)
MTHALMQRELILDLEVGDYQVNPVSDPRIIGPVDYGWVRFSDSVADAGRDDPDVLTWGGGPLAGSRIPGTRRLVFCGYSPQWQGFYVSSLGGAAYVMHRVGVDFVCIRGRAPQDSVLILNHQQGQISVRLEPIDADALWTGYAGPEGEYLIGFYALQQAVFDRYAAEYDGDWVRVFGVGPAARHTNQGVIGSNHVRQGRITSIDDWAGRGGLGSQLLQRHRIAACVFGGEWEDPDLKDSKEIDGYFQEHYGQSMIRVDLGATEKYRYVPGFRTGGTFGVNMHTADDKLLSFNYQSVYQSDQARLAQHSAFILDHYLQQFNREIIEPKNFAHCGEPCSVACKKYDGVYKKDYEPYQALGPLCGIFDQRAAEELNHFVDAMGLDAIQTGGTVAWIMELVHSGLIPPADFGLPPLAEMRFDFASDPEIFDLEVDSRRNADYAYQVVYMMLFDERGEPFRRGIRAAAEALDERYGLTEPGQRTLDRAVFTARGEQGCMTPNQYWVPGMLSPMPMMGKYFVYYGLDFMPPRDLGRKCVERMVYELFNENSGVCRFHRKWAETIVDEIISCHYEFPVDYKAHQFKLARQIYEHYGKGTLPWESQRTIDVIWHYLEKWDRFGLDDQNLQDWLDRFRGVSPDAEEGEPAASDRWAAARAYWEEIREGIREAFEAGPEAIPGVVSPYRAAKMDVMESKEREGIAH